MRTASSRAKKLPGPSAAQWRSCKIRRYAKPTLFIGSSSEGLATARAIKEQFDSEMDVTLWNEGVFKLNTSTLESLLRVANFFDFRRARDDAG